MKLRPHHLLCFETDEFLKIRTDCQKFDLCRNTEVAR